MRPAYGDRQTACQACRDWRMVRMTLSEDDQHAALMRRAILAVAGAALLADRTRAAIAHAVLLMRDAAPLVHREEWTVRMRTDAARAVGELEVASRSAER